jgi:pseudouridine synthase
MRLQKFLSMAGVCSRRKGEEYIKAGLVKVNGETITQLGTKIDPENDEVTFKDTPVVPRDNRIYIALNKPEGYVTTCMQKREKIILDLLDIKERVYPIGRLDKESTGLILLTSDGSLHQRLAHPSFDHEKEYEVTVGKPILDKALKRMAAGMTIMGSKTRPAKTKRLSEKKFLITLKEGRNRQIRKMVRKVGNHVTELKRVRVSKVKLGRLAEGSWRYLTEKEKNDLLNPKK